MQGSQPPGLWQSDLLSGGPSLGMSTLPTQPLKPVPDSAEQVAGAWRHVQQAVIGSGKDADLYDLLQSARREDTYQIHASGWPSLLRPLSPVMCDLPIMVQEKYRACQASCFCGMFPEIGRAWASVDNSLFLWRYDISNDVPVEYRGEDQAIISVGLAKPRPRVFLEAIQYVLVLCTAVEIVLLGVCPGRRAQSIDGTVTGELQLQPLPLYTIPSDNVLMVSVAATSTGRIFLGGSDGHLYEMMYTSGDSWRKRRCSKVRLTGGLQQLLPAFLPSFVFGAPSPLVSVVVDNERHILYTLAHSGAIQVFDLGLSGTDSTPRKVAEISDVVDAAAKATMGREVFRSADKNRTLVKYIAPISLTESRKLHLMALTSDGCRLYFTTYNLTARAPATAEDALKLRPTLLVAAFARPALPQPSLSIGRLGTAERQAAGLEVMAAHYSNGTLLLSESTGSSGRTTKLLVATRNLTRPVAAVNTSSFTSQHGLRESVASLDNHVPGETCALVRMPTRSPVESELSKVMRDELFTQIFVPPPRFVVISTAGVLELEKRRPVEILSQVLQEHDNTRLAQLFEDYGPPEVACMCYILATTPSGTVPPRVLEGARGALENEQLVGEPQMPEDRATALDTAADTNQGIYMGQAINPNPEPCWSAEHKGLCLYVSRVLHLAWEEPVAVTPKGKPQLLELGLPRGTMQVLESKLRALDSFLGQQQTRRSARSYGASTRPPLQPLTAFGINSAADTLAPVAKRQRTIRAVQQQEQRTNEIRGLVRRASEALSLLQILASRNLGRLAAKLDSEAQAKLKGMALRDLVYDNQAEGVARLLISVLVGEHISASGAVVEDLAGLLKSSCPSFFKEDDDLYYQATARLKQAENSSNLRQREQLAAEAVSMLLRVPSSCNLEYMVSQLAYLRQYEGLVELVLRAAEAKDPENLAANPAAGAAHAAAVQLREACYLHIISVLRALINPAAGAAAGNSNDTLSVGEREKYKNAVLQAAVRSKDNHFQTTLYSHLVDMDASKELLSLGNNASLEQYLIKAGGLPSSAPAQPIGPLTVRQVHHLDLLARLFTSQRRFRDAAVVHKLLGERASGSGEQSVTLQARLDHLQQAELQARSVGDSALVTEMEAALQVALFQRDIVEALQAKSANTAGEEQATLQHAVQELTHSLKTISDLYNDYAQPQQLWDMCLRIFHFSNQSAPDLVRQLWELVLKQTAISSATPLQAACACVADLGAEFYPNEESYPMALVAGRLEQIAIGVWPELHEAGPPTDLDLVTSTLLSTCQNSWSAVQRAYDVLLSRRVTGLSEQELSLPRLRAQLLQSLYQLCLQVKDRFRSGTTPLSASPMGFSYGQQYNSASREAGLLAMACEKYALESRKLGGGQADTLYHNFEALRQQLERA